MRLWSSEEANAALARVSALVERAQAATRALLAAGASAVVDPTGDGQGRANGHAVTSQHRRDLERIVAALEEEGIVLRDPERGLVDFVAESRSGRRYWLCWVVGEPAVAWWHWPEDGFAGRTPLTEPPR